MTRFLFSLKFYIFFFLIVNTQFYHSQDPLFTQFYSNPIYLNPAFSGSNKCPRIVSNYRNQWSGLSGNFITTAIAYDQGSDFLNGGFGVLVSSDQISKTLKTNELSFSYSYHQNISRNFSINYGIQSTYIQKSVNVSNLTFSDMIDPKRGFVFSTKDIVSGESVNVLDFSAGIIGYSDKFYFGLSTHHLSEPSISFINNGFLSPLENKLSRRYTFIGGTEILINNSSLSEDNKMIESFSPSFIYSKQGNFQQLNLGLYYKRGIYVVGGWFRFHPDISNLSSDSFILTLGVQGKLFRVGYSYDFNTSQLSFYSGGSHELSLALKLYCKPKKKSIRAMSCPTF